MAAVALGGVYNLTKEPIEASKKAKLQKAIAQVLPPFSEIAEKEVMPAEGKDPLVFYEASQDGEVVGTAIKTYNRSGVQRPYRHHGRVPERWHHIQYRRPGT